MTSANFDLDRLLRLDAVAPMLVAITGDERWATPSAELIAGGKSNLTYRLSSGAGELVLRRPPDGSVLATAHDMGREARVQRALAGTAVPVPEILLFDPGDAIGVPFYVMASVPGLVLRERLPDGFATTLGERRALGFAVVDTLADLHRIDPNSVGLADYGRPDGFLLRQVSRWTRQWDASRNKSSGLAIDELARRLAASVPLSRTSTIVHGDYRMDNCIVDGGHPARIAAVLDWELSTLGDPLTDLGMLQFYWADAAALIPSIISTVTTEPGFPTPDEVADRWSTRTCLPTDGLGWYRAFAHFKFAVIAAGVAARVRAGAMSGQDFGDVAAEITATAEAGLHLARR